MRKNAFFFRTYDPSILVCYFIRARGRASCCRSNARAADCALKRLKRQTVLPAIIDSLMTGKYLILGALVVMFATLACANT